MTLTRLSCRVCSSPVVACTFFAGQTIGWPLYCPVEGIYFTNGKETVSHLEF